MTEYKIHPLVVGTLGAIKGVVTFNVDFFTPLVAPVLAFYLEGGDKKILVDVGVVEPGESGEFHGFPLFSGGADGVTQALETVGLKPEDIDIVILTHMHFDHAANVDLFPKAQFILQKEEWKYAKSPLPTQKGVYLPELIEKVEKCNLVLVDGDYEVADGVSVCLVPGHTQGQQGVVVNTADGYYVIAGDLMYATCNIFPELTELQDAAGNIIECTPQYGHAFYPPGIHTNLTDWYDSAWKVLRLAGFRDHILAGHDPALMGKVFPLS